MHFGGRKEKGAGTGKWKGTGRNGGKEGRRRPDAVGNATRKRRSVVCDPHARSCGLDAVSVRWPNLGQDISRRRLSQYAMYTCVRHKYPARIAVCVHSAGELALQIVSHCRPPSAHARLPSHSNAAPECCVCYSSSLHSPSRFGCSPPPAQCQRIASSSPCSARPA